MSGPGSGDKLARGSVRANFQTTEGGVSEKKWSDIFDTFDPEAFKNAPNKSMQRTEPVDGIDASGETPGVSGVGIGTTESEPITR